MAKVEQRHPNINWAERKIVVLPVQSMDEEFLHSLHAMGRRPEQSIESTFTYRLPAKGDDDNRTIRVYIGNEYAATMREEADTIGEGGMYGEQVEIMLMVVMMEAYITHGEESMKDECVKYARHLRKDLLLKSFDVAQAYFSEHDVPTQVLTHDIISYIQQHT